MLFYYIHLIIILFMHRWPPRKAFLAPCHSPRLQALFHSGGVEHVFTVDGLKG